MSVPTPSIQPHRWWRWRRLAAALVAWGRGHAEELAEDGVQAKGEVAREAQARGNDHARQVLLGAFHGVVNNAEGEVGNVFVNTGGYNPVHEQGLQIERVNDFGQLRPDRGRQVFFSDILPISIAVRGGSLSPEDQGDIR